VKFVAPSPPTSLIAVTGAALPNQETVAGERQYFGDRQAKLTTGRFLAGSAQVQLSGLRP
jgi:hypothetical protein